MTEGISIRVRERPVIFDGAFPDGLLGILGWTFNCAGHKWAIHKIRAEYQHKGTPAWRVSHVETGFGLPITSSTKAGAARSAQKFLSMITLDRLDAAIKEAARMRPANRISE